MSQLTREISFGNTIQMSQIKKLKSRNRARSWFLTLNHPTLLDKSQCLNKIFFQNLKIIKYIIQEEEGKKGTPHFQGAVQFENQVDFNVLRTMHPTAHWEKCKNLIQSLKYCGKLDTRKGCIYTYGDVNRYIEKPPITMDEWLKDFRKMHVNEAMLRAGPSKYFECMG